jgi:hypothetical protein
MRALRGMSKYPTGALVAGIQPMSGTLSDDSAMTRLVYRLDDQR